METQCARYQLTINHPDEKGYTHEHISEIISNHFKTVIYYCMADEEGSCYHTHVFIVFSSRVRFSMIKKYFPEAHIEACRGSVSDNVSYVKKCGKWELDTNKAEKKIDGTFEEFGTQPPDSRGRRNDMTALYQMISDGMTNAEILSIDQDYILQIDKLDKIRTTILSERFKSTTRLDLQVIYISGYTGTGKTRGVLEDNGYENVFRITDYQHPFDGYRCEPVIAFDEFYSSISLRQMLLYCDIYPIELPSRFANKFACYNKVYIISNWPLEKQYESQQVFDAETWKAFLRRIKIVITYDEKGNRTEYSSVAEYYARNKKGTDYDDF